MAKRKRPTKYQEEQFDIANAEESVMSEIEGAAEEGVQYWMREFGVSKAKAYKKVKKLVQQVGKYGF